MMRKFVENNGFLHKQLENPIGLGELLRRARERKFGNKSVDSRLTTHVRTHKIGCKDPDCSSPETPIECEQILKGESGF